MQILSGRIMKPPHLSESRGTLTLAMALLLLFSGCGGDNSSTPSSPDAVNGTSGAVYPMFVDTNGNGVSDYLERATHDSGATTASRAARRFQEGPAPLGHQFVDGNGDGICDYAQNGSNTWHGPCPGDGDGDGICDCWDEDCPCSGDHFCLQYRDRNRNRINDNYEAGNHEQWGHEYRDGDGDGICDCAQDGSDCWHGPGYVDGNGNGTCDHWEPGGSGHGRHRGN